MEHTVHLGAKTFIETIAPSPQKKRSTKNGTATVEDDKNGGKGDSDGEDEDEATWAADWEMLAEVSDDTEIDEAITFEPGDVLGKALALITQVIFILFLLKSILILV